MPNIEQYNRTLADMEQMAKRAKAQIQDLQRQIEHGVAGGNVSGDLSRQIDQARELTRAYRELEAERSKLSGSYKDDAQAVQSMEKQIRRAHELEQAYRQLGETKKSTETYIAGGASQTASTAGPRVQSKSSNLDLDKVDAKYRPAIEKAKSSLSKIGIVMESVAGIEQTLNGTLASVKLGRKVGGETLTQNYKLFVDDMGNWGKRLAELRGMQFINDPKNADLLDAAKNSGFSPKHFKNSFSEHGGAYETATFSRNEAGRTINKSFRRDQYGAISDAPVRKQSQSFTQGIGKDLGDLVKWSVAIAAIYGPINAVTEAIGHLIENQSKLADVSIAVNENVANTGQIFDDVYESAKLSGEGVAGVIDAFGQAYQAAGRVENEFQRYDAAIKLTNDSLTLSKLSTLDQAGAIDVLTAALYQTAPAGEKAADSFSRGGDLLDKWVRVSKIASVSVETLATGVAVLGDSAETAGLSMEQLNALIATISETSLSSGKETANIAKALVGNYQQAGAIKELNRLGIVVTDTTGKTREFIDVMNDVAALRKNGILGDQDFGRLTLALGGGGIRQQKNVSALIENWDRMNQIAGSQEGTSGESQTALAKKLATVETASTKLDNAFISLAQTMGEEGGLLTSFTDVINLGTSLVEILDKLASGAGKVTPLLLAFGAAALVMRGKDITSSLATNVTGPMANYLGAPGGSGLMAAQMLSGQRNILGNQTGTGRLSTLGTLPTMAAIGLPAIQNFRSGETEEGLANIVGGGLGAIAGGPAGALIGSAIAESFVRKTLTYETQFADFFAGTISNGTQKAGADGQLNNEDLMRQAFKAIGGGSEGAGKFSAWFTKLSSQQTLGEKILGKNHESYATEESAAYSLLLKKDPELAAKIKAQYSAQGASITGEVAPIDRVQQQRYSQDSGYLSEIQRDRQGQLQSDLIKGDLKPSDYANRMASLSAFTTSATREMAALVGESNKLPKEFASAKDAYGAFLDIASSGNQELINQINQQVQAVAYYQEQLENWTTGTPITNQATGELFTPDSKKQIEELAKQAQSTLANTASYGQQQVRLQNLKLQDVYGGNVTPTASGSDINKVIASTQKVQDRRYSDLDPRDYSALKESWEPFKVLVEEAGKVFYKEISGIDKSIFGENFQAMQDSGEISGASKGLGFTEMDITKPQLDQAVTKANALTKQLEGKGYKSNVEDTLIATSDEQISKQHVDMKILQYILQQILDTEKKQLEGVYNLPEGATAFVPLSAALLSPGAGLGDSAGGNSFGLKDPTVNVPNTSLDSGTIDNWWAKQYGGQNVPSNSVEKAINTAVDGTPISKEYVSPSEEGISDGHRIANGKSMEDSSSLMSVFSQFIENLKGMLMPQQGGLPGGIKGGQDLGSIRGQTGSPATSEVSTKLDLKFSSTTQLIVDGRMLATIIKPYLAADLLKTNESGGTVTRSYVI